MERAGAVAAFLVCVFMYVAVDAIIEEKTSG